MNAVKPVVLDTPSGPIELRWTAGASRRLTQRFGGLEKVGDDPTSMAEACWYLMFDEDGKPPDGLSVERWLESIPLSEESMLEFAAALGAAISGKEKNVVRVEAETLVEKQTGSDSTPSPTNVSASPGESSGGDTPSKKSTHSPTSGESSKKPSTPEPDSAKPKQ